jgi:flagellar biosynthesis component FlhA
VTALVRRISEEIAALEKRRIKPALVCSTALRPHIRRLIERSVTTVPVLSYAEIPRRATLEIVAQIPGSILGPAPEPVSARAARPEAVKA